MPSDLVATQARALVDQDRIQLLRTPGIATVAQVRGRSKTYLVTLDHGGAFCTCPAAGSCSHIEAVRLQLEGEPMDTTETLVDPDTGELVELLEEGTEPGEATELEDRTPAVPETDTPHPALLAIAETPVTFRTLQTIAATEFVPKDLRGRPEAVLAAVLYGRELGLGPMEALAHVDVIDGRPSPSAELLNRMIRRAGHTLEVLEASDTRCAVRGTRADTGETLEVEFSIADAERVTVKERGEWVPLSETVRYRSWPGDMLWSRAISRLARRLFPDLTEARG